MEEIWKTIEGFEGLYEVSNLGRVRSLDRVRKAGYGSTANIKGKILTPQYLNDKKYLSVNLYRNEVRMRIQATIMFQILNGVIESTIITMALRGIGQAELVEKLLSNTILKGTKFQDIGLQEKQQGR